MSDPRDDGLDLCVPDDPLWAVPGLRVPPAEKAADAKALNAAARQADTEPTEAQKDAGNYRKGHYQQNGLHYVIENPIGSTRSGTSKNGTKWSTKMKLHYGYLASTEGSDGDGVDCFLDPAHIESELFFVVNQLNADGSFDEHKVMVGFTNEEEARRGYLDHYHAGWKGLGSIEPMTLPQFKKWLKGDTTKAAADAPRIVFVKWAREKREGPFTVAVDLDGTLAEKEEPFNPKTIGKPRAKMVKWVKRLKEAGARIIIWTVRGSDKLVETWLKEYKVPFDHINYNPDQPEGSSGKLIADVYWDDRGFSALDPDATGPAILRQLNDESEPDEPDETGTTIEITTVKILLSPANIIDHITEAA